MMMFQGSVILLNIKLNLVFLVQTEINQMINDMQKQGVIEESSNSWYSLVVLKQKKMALGGFA